MGDGSRQAAKATKGVEMAPFPSSSSSSGSRDDRSQSSDDLAESSDHREKSSDDVQKSLAVVIALAHDRVGLPTDIAKSLPVGFWHFADGRHS